MAIVFLDLDGTLLYHGRPAPRAVDAIRQLKENGHIPIIATGRVPFLVIEIKEELGIDSYICANGTFIVYQNQLVLEKPIPTETVKRLFHYADIWQFDIVMEGKDVYFAYRKESPIVDEFSDIFNIEHPRLDKEYHLNHPLLSFNVFDDDVVAKLIPLFPELVFNKANRIGWDINLAGDLKADGMRHLVKLLKIPKKEVYAIGDGYNDLTMIQQAHVGIAMGNAYDEVKKAASYITTNAWEGGVYDALKHYKLI